MVEPSCADTAVTGLAWDSRAVAPGDVYVALPGERVDGHDFAAAAVQAGAAGVLASHALDEASLDAVRAAGAFVIEVADTAQSVTDLARAWRGRLAGRVVGVTGSTGKTSTKNLVRDVLSAAFTTVATEGNQNNELGVPKTLLNAQEDTEAVVVEMGMRGLGQIEGLCSFVRPQVGVITNVGESHIELLGSRENIARAKMEIVLGMRPAPEGAPAPQTGAAPVLVLPADDDFFPFMCERARAERSDISIVRAGASSDCAYRMGAAALDADGHPHFTAGLPGGAALEVTLSTTGAQSVSNAILAIAVGDLLGVAAHDMASALSGLAITGRRQEIRRARSGARVIDDSYNASPESMAAALDLLELLPATGSRIAVLGEIGELGDEAPRLHALVGAYAAAKKPDYLVCVGADGAHDMAAAARLMGLSDDAVLELPDVDAAIERLTGAFRADDVVLVKGSRFVGLDRLVEEVC